MEKKILLPKNLPKTIHFVRHAQSLVNVDEWECTKEATSNFTAPLTQKGLTQTNQLGTYLRSQNLPAHTVYFASTFLRPQQTLQYSIHPKQLYIDPRLDEWYKGVFHANYPKTIDTVFAHDATAKNRDTLYYHRPTFGESQKDVQSRTAGFLHDIASEGFHEIFIAGHGRSGRILLDMLQGKNWSNNGEMEKIKNCEYFRCVRNGPHYDVTAEFKPD
ncbi:MAG TPA: histidine phosphatase family protein [Acidobacteriota bacterium]|nr:histidine phosphatase family protein [Acidobacteriota bacterium]